MIEHQPATEVPPRRSPRRDRARLVAAGTVAAVLVLLLILLAGPDRDGVPRAAARTDALPLATVSVNQLAPAQAVPRSYFGLSTEYWTLPHYELHLPVFERVLSLLHVQGDGPMVLRIGGDSADHTYWDPASREMPRWVFKLTPAWLSQTRALVRQTGLRLIVDLNVITGSPTLAGEWALAAERVLPHGSITGFEIGNEDDIYSHSYWRAMISPTRLDPGFLPSSFSPATYILDYQAYAGVLARVAPRVPLLGPALANPAANAGWISSLLSGPHPGLRMVSAHRYPFSACARRRAVAYPTISRLLSARASTGMARSVARSARLAHQAGIRFRLTELNSVTCGGLAGVSDSFATALWAPDSLFALLRAGVDGVNLHIRANTINAPFALGGYGLLPRPLLYGLILFTRTLGPDAQLLRVRLEARRPLQLSAWAVRVRGNNLHVLVIDKGSQSTRLRFQLPASGPATVERLLAPSVRARAGVTLDGQQLGSDGTWRGAPSAQTITPGKQGYSLTIRRDSAVLLSFSPSGLEGLSKSNGPAQLSAMRLSN